MAGPNPSLDVPLSADPHTPSNPTNHPPLGSLIDSDRLKLVEVLGIGGYGVVYRGVDACSSKPKSYAVKCLLRSQLQQSARRQVHIREIALHQISSAHPGVITLHRVVEEGGHTFIVMDYAPDNDLFTQILNHCRYVGDDVLIKHVFLQLLDAVEYCHSLGIYHRDLKPENVLCFDDGCRVAITDFGLATTEKVSRELRTGSIYHMSPECQGGGFSPDGTYVPMSNDVWSLGIILVNLATGRNPWKTATPDDPTFQAYLRDPSGFFPSVLPVSSEINNILVRILHTDWRERITLHELREALEDVQGFYSEDVMFEGSVARCSWEAGFDIEGYPSDHEDDLDWSGDGPKSVWSRDSRSSFYPRTPDGPPTTLLSAHGVTNGASYQSDSSFFSYSSSPSFPSHDGDIWTTVQSSKDLGMEDVLETPSQNIEDVFLEEVSLDERSLSTPVFPTISSPCVVDTDEQTGAMLSPTPWMPYKGHLCSSSRTSLQSTTSSGPSCVISFARSSTPSSDTSSWSGKRQSKYLPGVSIYTSRDFHDSKVISFKQFTSPRRLDLGPVSKDQHRAAFSAYSRESSPTAIHSCFGPSLDRSPGGGSIQTYTTRSRRTSSFSSRSWFLLGKMFASSAAA